ncbi:unnamed protein product [Allacma fusca]|nr:unnamed protein product [Allacma fusca]
MISRFIKGVSNLRPPRPRYNFTWDPKIVLEYLRTVPTLSCSMEQLTTKLSTLLAIITAHRVQTFASIEVSDIKLQSEYIDIFISGRIKTSRVNRPQPVLHIPYFSGDGEICAATVLKEYIRRTETVRGDQSKLFLSICRPYKPVTAQTIGRWIKTVLTRSGIDMTIFSAHSTRHASTSSAAAQGINIETIRQAAGWTASSTMFAKFYKQPIINRSEFAESVCRP